MYINTTGLVLRETRYKDSSKILTVLTSGEGKLAVTARGALRRNSKLAAVTQLLTYSEMTLFKSRDRWTLTEAQNIEQFAGLRNDLRSLALGSYFAELCEAVADEDSPNPEILTLCLNALYVLSEGVRQTGLIKAAFELRLVAAAGFEPLVSRCAECGGTEPERAYLDLTGGTLKCAACIPADKQGLSAALSFGAVQAMRYIIGCAQKRIFSFELGAAAMGELSGAAELYLLAQLDRRFRTLEYYKSIAR